MNISFVIITIGSNPKKLARCIRSIKRNFATTDSFEIILVGNNIPEIDLTRVKVIEDLEKKNNFLVLEKT